MNNISNYILEKLKVNSQSKINNISIKVDIEGKSKFKEKI